MAYTCRYCNSQYQKNTEHVFPSGLGGQDVYVDCVCPKCNNEFSQLEMELIQKSPVAFIRLIDGTKLEGGKKLRFKAPIQLHYREDADIVYEMGQGDDVKIFIRPQIIRKDTTYYIEGSIPEDIRELYLLTKKWYDCNLKIRLPFDSAHPDVALQFKRSGQAFTSEKVTVGRNQKGFVQIYLLDANHDLFNKLESRLYMNDDRDLIVRSRSESEALDFIKGFLRFCAAKGALVSYSNEGKIANPLMSIGQSFKFLQAERALCKIGLNAIFQYFPKYRQDPSFDLAISFVRTGNPEVPSELQQKSEFIDTRDDAHNIFFRSDKGAVYVRISLYAGRFVYIFMIPGLIIPEIVVAKRLLIFYNERRNYLQPEHEMIKELSSFKLPG
jgi:hypothetical protein